MRLIPGVPAPWLRRITPLLTQQLSSVVEEASSFGWVGQAHCIFPMALDDPTRTIHGLHWLHLGEGSPRASISPDPGFVQSFSPHFGLSSPSHEHFYPNSIGQDGNWGFHSPIAASGCGLSIGSIWRTNLAPLLVLAASVASVKSSSLFLTEAGSWPFCEGEVTPSIHLEPRMPIRSHGSLSGPVDTHPDPSSPFEAMDVYPHPWMPSRSMDSHVELQTPIWSHGCPIWICGSPSRDMDTHLDPWIPIWIHEHPFGFNGHPMPIQIHDQPNPSLGCSQESCLFPTHGGILRPI